jgi:hypothetical protein
MAKKQISSMLPLVAGIFILILVYGTGVGRSAKPADDGHPDNFDIALVGHAARAEVNDIYWIDLRVTNPNEAGQMFVQCSILDMDVHGDWLANIPLAQSAVLLPTRDNCVENEPFTQTAQVNLARDATETVRFTITVPDNVAGNNMIFCDTYEQCGDNSKSSSSLREPVTIVTNDAITSNNNVEIENSQEYACELNMDCPNYLFGSIDCYNGYCMDKEDIPLVESPSKISDFKLKKWIAEHKIIVTLIGLGLVIVGAFGVYSSPKTSLFE